MYNSIYNNIQISFELTTVYNGVYVPITYTMTLHNSFYLKKKTKIITKKGFIIKQFIAGLL